MVGLSVNPTTKLSNTAPNVARCRGITSDFVIGRGVFERCATASLGMAKDFINPCNYERPKQSMKGLCGGII